MVYVFTGDGKGKTSAALGTVLRAIGNKMSVSWVAWYKQNSWKLSEIKPLEKLGARQIIEVTNESHLRKLPFKIV